MIPRLLHHSFILFLGICIASCSSDTSEPIVDQPQENNKSDEALLLDLVVSHANNNYNTSINQLDVTVDEDFLDNIDPNFTIQSFKISESSSANIAAGETVQLENSFSIQITAEDGITKKEYNLSANTFSEGELLFEKSSFTSCEEYANHRFGEITIENNLWNSSNLEPGSFSQCVYQFQNRETSLFGWKWSFPANAFGVNAYPEAIYGWKPWFSESNTPNLPKKISEISELKVTYETEIVVNEGDYNLAFDNWICSSSQVNPGTIQFEFMIWEDMQNLVPFGNYQEDVTTSNGVYKFYMGEPDWEPEGSNWTYVAFARTEKRRNGKVDIDELLQYLVNKGIVDSQSYLSSIEIGNEVGNSTGYTIFKKFDVNMN